MFHQPCSWPRTSVLCRCQPLCTHTAFTSRPLYAEDLKPSASRPQDEVRAVENADASALADRGAVSKPNGLSRGGNTRVGPC
jgi:hypothetical protein